MAQTMGFGTWVDKLCKRKNRWIFKIDDVVDDGASALPPLKSARPSLTFKEMEAQHINETIFFPSKPEWKPIQLTLYDIDGRESKVIDWVKQIYDAENGTWETWIFENAWPQVIEWGELDMADSSVVTVDITLRYDRAYRQA